MNNIYICEKPSQAKDLAMKKLRYDINELRDST